MNDHHQFLEQALAQLAPVRQQLMNHAVYKAIKSDADLRIFMKYHVFAVWDFMSLLKTLQQELTCIVIPWTPPKYPIAARLINEIVLAEESDTLGDNQYTSHFDLYTQAMRNCSADTNEIDELIKKIHQGVYIRDALTSTPLPVNRFVNCTWDFIESGKIWKVASAFALGREEIIPDMFRNFNWNNNTIDQNQFATLRQYLDLHIITDEHHHVPMAFRLLQALCQNDPEKWSDVVEAANLAISRRIELWDGVITQIKSLDLIIR